MFGTLGDRPGGVALFNRSGFDFTSPASQDGMDRLSVVASKISHAGRQIHAQFLNWANLREQVFHRHKMEARGSIRQAPNVMSWTLPLRKLCGAGGNDASATIRAWNQEASEQQQLFGTKALALRNVLGLLLSDLLD